MDATIVLIDSNVICADYYFKGASFGLLLGAVKQGALELRVPRIVLDEAANKLSEQLTACRDTIEGALAVAARATRRRVITPHIDVLDAAEEYPDRLRGMLASAGARILDYPTVSHEDIVGRALARRRPFKKNGAGYRDSLIWTHVLDTLMGSDKAVAFVTSDGDFVNGASGLHPDLLEDIDAAGLSSERITLYRQLSGVVQVVIKPMLTERKDARIELSSGFYQGVDLWTTIRDQVSMQLILATPWAADPPAPEWWPQAEILDVHEVTDFQVGDVRETPTGELLLTIAASARCDVGPDAATIAAIASSGMPYYHSGPSGVQFGVTTVKVGIYAVVDKDSGKVMSVELRDVIYPWTIVHVDGSGDEDLDDSSRQ